jgi:hypothetical protein
MLKLHTDALVEFFLREKILKSEGIRQIGLGCTERELRALIEQNLEDPKFGIDITDRGAEQIEILANPERDPEQ